MSTVAGTHITSSSDEHAHVPPRVAATGTATGLLLMAVFAARSRLPADLSMADRVRRRRTGRAFGIVVGAEGAAIWVAAALLGATGHDNVVVPVIALIVGLHFYPMARIFDRHTDTYLASWTCLLVRRVP